MMRTFPLQVHISTLFIAMILLVGGAIGGIGYLQTRDLVDSTARDLTERLGRETQSRLQGVLATAGMATSLIARTPIAEAGGLAERLGRAALAREALERFPALASIHVGYGNGDFFLVRRLRSAEERQSFRAPEGTDIVVQSIEVRPPGAARGRFVFLDREQRVLREDDRPDYARGFDPRTRDWYRLALASPDAVMTPAYRFYTNRKVGTTVARRIGGNVVAADIHLETLDAWLASRLVTAASELALVDATGKVIAYSGGERSRARASPGEVPDLATLRELDSPALARFGADSTVASADPATVRYEMPDGAWQVFVRPIVLEGGGPLRIVAAIPERELLAGPLKLRETSLLVTLVVILLAVGVSSFSVQ